MVRPTITLYTKPDCHLCNQARAILQAMRSEVPFELEERDIRAEETLHRSYFDRIPVVALDGRDLCEYVVDEQVLREALRLRADALESR